MEAARDEIPFGLDEDDSYTLAALRIALASIEAGACGVALSIRSYAKIRGAWQPIYNGLGSYSLRR